MLYVDLLTSSLCRMDHLNLFSRQSPIIFFRPDSRTNLWSGILIPTPLAESCRRKHAQGPTAGPSRPLLPPLVRHSNPDNPLRKHADYQQENLLKTSDYTTAHTDVRARDGTCASEKKIPPKKSHKSVAPEDSGWTSNLK